MNAADHPAADRIAGIREDLPSAEHVLWQGSPSWRSLARHAFHLHQTAAYFALLTAAASLMAVSEGRSATAGWVPAALGAVACLLLALLAWLSARTTIYAITTGRVFLRIGIAVPISVNLPLSRIPSAGLKLHGDGSGDLPLELEASAHLAWLHLWPHVRPWRIGHPEPMLRGVADAEMVARILADALRAAQLRGGTSAAPAARPAVEAPAALACGQT